YAGLDLARQRRHRRRGWPDGRRRPELPPQPRRARQRRETDCRALRRPLRQGEEGEARHQYRDARAVAPGAGNGHLACRRDHQVSRGCRRLSRADRAQVGDGSGRSHLQTARQIAGGELVATSAALISPSLSGGGGGADTSGLPWWGFAIVLTAWCAGIMAVVLMSPLIPWLLFATVSMTVVALVNRRLALMAGLCLVPALIGAARGATVATVELPPGLAGQSIAVSGSVDDDPVDRRGARRLTVRVDHVLTRAGEFASGLRSEVAVYGATPVHYGDLVLLSGELQAPPRFDQFDYRAYLAEQGIAGVMPSAKLVRVTSNPGDPLHTMLFGLRHAVIAAIDRALPEPQAALLLGVVFGYRAALPRPLEQQMIASGLIHIVVISGLKVSLLARIVQQAIGRLAPRAAPLIAAGAMVVYALLAGASAAAPAAAA